MKSLLKLGLLFTLIIAGRYLQLTAPAAVAGLPPTTPATQVSTPLPITFVRYSLPIAKPQPVATSQPRKRRPASWE